MWPHSYLQLKLILLFAELDMEEFSRFGVFFRRFFTTFFFTLGVCILEWKRKERDYEVLLPWSCIFMCKIHKLLLVSNWVLGFGQNGSRIILWLHCLNNNMSWWCIPHWRRFQIGLHSVETLVQKCFIWRLKRRRTRHVFVKQGCRLATKKN